MGTWRRRVRGGLLAVVALIGPPVGYVAWDAGIQHNFGTLEAGRIYRSGQLPASELATTVRQKGIKTVLNLRGININQSWYVAERDATTRAGATQVDVSMSSCLWMSRVQLREVVRLLDVSEYPLLIHCQWGAERTGWIAAVATLLRPGATLDDARNQFSLAYLFVRVGDGKVMAEHFDQYEHWLAANHWTHEPSRFRYWVDTQYVPGKPSREDWPYDPYPLAVITRPASEAEVRRR